MTIKGAVVSTSRPLSNLVVPALISVVEDSAVVSTDDLNRARAAAAQADKRVDQALVELGLMTEARLRSLLTEQLGIADISDADLPEAPLFPDRLGEPFLRHAGVLPIRVEDEVLVLGMLDPLDDFSANAVALKLNLPVRRLRLSSAQLETALQSFFGTADDEAEVPPPPSPSSRLLSGRQWQPDPSLWPDLVAGTADPPFEHSSHGLLPSDQSTGLIRPAGRLEVSGPTSSAMRRASTRCTSAPM